jgi:predicted nuclease of restriction endonuclease-like (RecB) superfamily
VGILDGARDATVRQFYVEQALHHGWSRDVLMLHMERRLHLRQGAASNNIERTLSIPTSDLARQAQKMIAISSISWT